MIDSQLALSLPKRWIVRFETRFGHGEIKPGPLTASSPVSRTGDATTPELAAALVTAGGVSGASLLLHVESSDRRAKLATFVKEYAGILGAAMVRAQRIRYTPEAQRGAAIGMGKTLKKRGYRS